jgi:hypothetical protein
MNANLNTLNSYYNINKYDSNNRVIKELKHLDDYSFKKKLNKFQNNLDSKKQETKNDIIYNNAIKLRESDSLNNNYSLLSLNIKA